MQLMLCVLIAGNTVNMFNFSLLASSEVLSCANVSSQFLLSYWQLSVSVCSVWAYYCKVYIMIRANRLNSNNYILSSANCYTVFRHIL